LSLTATAWAEDKQEDEAKFDAKAIVGKWDTNPV